MENTSNAEAPSPAATAVSIITAPSEKTGERSQSTTQRYLECKLPEGLQRNEAETPVNPTGHTNTVRTVRYTCATCLPDDFCTSGYELRFQGKNPVIFIAITLYNEDAISFCRTMHAVIENVEHLCGTKRSNGNEDVWTWTEIVVCIIADGQSAVHEETLKVLTLMGCYQEHVVQAHKGPDVRAHIFEHTTLFKPKVDGDGNLGKETTLFPLQVIFCLKKQNLKKLNSHRWFFNAFCKTLNPDICILLDVGTKPYRNAFYELWKCFNENPNVGGACGEICVSKGRSQWQMYKELYVHKLLVESPLAACQNFEYKMMAILDKPLESVLGYITVLPGAFSAYRYEALKSDTKDGPLDTYFKGENPEDFGLLNRNMYLAEDRVLCFEIIAKKDSSAWTLRYVRKAKASTDVPTAIPEFILQRRRWLNGSLAASIYSTTKTLCGRIEESRHSFARKILLYIGLVHNLLQLLMTATSMANFYLTFYFLMLGATSDLNDSAFGKAGKIIFIIVLRIYIVALFVTTVCSLGNDPEESRWIYYLSIVTFGICNYICMYCAAHLVISALVDASTPQSAFVEDAAYRDIIVFLVITVGLYTFNAFLYGEQWHILAAPQYLFYLPSYVNILSAAVFLLFYAKTYHEPIVLYALCNVHDVSWGTKRSPSQFDSSPQTTPDLPSSNRTSSSDHDLSVFEQKATERYSEINKDFQKLKVKKGGNRERDANGDRDYRTKIVLGWIGTNTLLVFVFTSDAYLNWLKRNRETDTGITYNPYLRALLILIAITLITRFIGSVAYRIMHS